VAAGAYAVSLIASLPGCGNLPPDKRARIALALVVACDVDGAVVPVAQPVVAALGAGGARTVSVDTILVHPAVVAACQQLGGMPAGATPFTAPAPTPADVPAP